MENFGYKFVPGSFHWFERKLGRKSHHGGVVSSLVFECTACNTKVLTTGSGCSTKNLEPKFGFGKAKFGGNGAARRGRKQRNSLSSGGAHHIPLHVNPSTHGRFAPFTGERSTVGR